MADLSYNEVSRLLKADFETGKLYWLARTPDMFKARFNSSEQSAKTWNTRFAGKEAFTALDGRGYLVGNINGRLYRAHRVVWMLHTGEWPADEIDHINRARTDNRISNLRCVSHADNMRNLKLHKSNSSGVAGVNWHDASGKWVARIGKRKILGYFDEFEDAVSRRQLAETEEGFHPNHGRSVA